MAFDFLKNNVLTALLEADYPAEAYYAAVSDPPDWSANSVWTDAKVGGNGCSRQHDLLHHPSDVQRGRPLLQRELRSDPEDRRRGRQQHRPGAPSSTSTPVVYYRVTVRVKVLGTP